MPIYAMRKMLLGDATNAELQERPLYKSQHELFPKLCLACLRGGPGTYSNCYKQHEVNIKCSFAKLEDADSKKQKQGQPDEVFKEDAPINLAWPWAVDTMHSKLMSMAQEESTQSTVVPHE